MSLRLTFRRKKPLGVIRSLLEEDLYVRDFELMAFYMSEGRVRSLKYSILERPIVLYKQDFITLMRRSLVLPT